MGGTAGLLHDRPVSGAIIETVKLDTVPPAETFLSREELVRYAGLRVEKRRRDWLGGRYALKLAALEFLADKTLALPGLTVVSGPNGQPRLFAKGRQAECAVSISHSGDYAVAAVGGGKTRFLGVDIEKVETRPECWAEQSFHLSEIQSDAPEFLTTLWAQKEAVLKALGIGLKADLWQVRILNAKPVYSGELSSVWEAAGKPELNLTTAAGPQGYVTALAFDR